MQEPSDAFHLINRRGEGQSFEDEKLFRAAVRKAEKYGFVILCYMYKIIGIGVALLFTAFGIMSLSEWFKNSRFSFSDNGLVLSRKGDGTKLGLNLDTGELEFGTKRGVSGSSGSENAGWVRFTRSFGAKRHSPPSFLTNAHRHRTSKH